MKNLKYLISAVLFLTLTSQLVAQLEFENNKVNVKAKVGDEKKSGFFKFKNVGDYPITIIKVKASCGCTTTKLDKKEYFPGESGEITATLKIGYREGLQTKNVYVQTSDPKKPKYNLTLQVDIPKIAKVQPRLLVWRISEEAVSKKMSIEFLIDDPIHVLRVENGVKNFKTEIEEIEKGRKYNIIVTPLSTEKRQQSIINIHTDYPKENPKPYTAYLRIQ